MWVGVDRWMDGWVDEVWVRDVVMLRGGIRIRVCQGFVLGVVG